MLANILKILHPFIPFFTETLWKKNKFNHFFKSDLVLAEWPEFKGQKVFNKNQENVTKLIELISSIRSTKSELNITPKLYCAVACPLFAAFSYNSIAFLSDCFTPTPNLHL